MERECQQRSCSKDKKLRGDGKTFDEHLGGTMGQNPGF
jgi:hypothetical protein